MKNKQNNEHKRSENQEKELEDFIKKHYITYKKRKI